MSVDTYADWFFLDDARSDEPQGNRLPDIPWIVDEALVLRCDNWGHVMRWRQRASVAINGGSTKAPPMKRYFATLGSFERNWRSPQGQHWHYGSAPTNPPDPDAADADVIENAVQAMDVYHHAILRYHHVANLGPAIVMRKAAKAGRCERSKLAGFTATLNMSYGLLRASLALPAVIQKARARERVQKVLQDG